MMKISRIVEMGPDELISRGIEGVTKRLERLAGAAGAATRTRPDHPAGSQSSARGGRFFPGATSPLTASLLSSLFPDMLQRTRSSAEAICQGRFDLLGYRGLTFGDPVDWHLDPTSGVHAPLKHWSLIDPLERATVGRVKVIWELNRHQWLVRLGQAWWLTGQERYARAAVGYLEDWMRRNPPGVGINWASSLEVGLRLISWCWTLHLLDDSKVFSVETTGRMLQWVMAHGAHVARYLSRYSSPNTHLTGEALALLYAGILFPKFPGAARWQELGSSILSEQIRRQVLDDGVYFEQSTCYQRYTVEIYMQALVLARLNSVVMPEDVEQAIQRLLDFLLAVRRPDGLLPQIGDSDGGCLLPLAPQSPDDPRGVFSTAAVLFGRPDYAWAAGGLAPETLWLLGAEAKESFEALRPAAPSAAPSRLFGSGGYAVMSSGWDEKAHHLIFDVGPLGCPMSGAHGHADLLSIQCSVFGLPVLVDPGTCCYTEEPAWRDHFRGTSAHTTVVLDGENQAAPEGPFSWKSRPEARLRRWTSTTELDYADAEHDAYMRLPDPVLHRRRVLFVKPRYWVVVDDLSGAGTHRVAVRFQFAPLPVALEADGWARARGPDGRGLLLRVFSVEPLEARVREGDLSPIEGWVSPDYGQCLSAPVLIHESETRLPVRIATLLLPDDNPSVPPPQVSALISDRRQLEGIVLEGGRELVLIAEDDLELRRR